MIIVVVPTIREECLKKFKKAWGRLFTKHKVEAFYVHDGESPYLEHDNRKLSVKDIMGRHSDLIYNFNDGVRNLGFAYASGYSPDYVITLDDDTLPVGDTIQDHINALNMRVSTSWMKTASFYTRGIPYNVRDEAEVVLSHGVWNGVPDWDAPTQLVKPEVGSYYKGVIPKGVLFPMCGMNIAFKGKLLPYMYFAPMGRKIGMDRFGDIWDGIEVKKTIDKKGWAVVSGYASVLHNRASNVFANLKKEVVGLELNENYGKDKYFRLYSKRRREWYVYCNIQGLPLW